MFQGLCIESCDWDSTLTGSDLEEWNSIQRELNELSEVKVPRYYSVLSPAQFVYNYMASAIPWHLHMQT